MKHSVAHFGVAKSRDNYPTEEAMQQTVAHFGVAKVNVSVVLLPKHAIWCPLHVSEAYSLRRATSLGSC